MHSKMMVMVRSVMVLLLAMVVTARADYLEREDVRQFAAGFADRHNKPVQQVLDVLGQGKKQPAILQAIARPAEKVLSWGEYRAIFIEPTRLEQGLAFWRDNRALVERIAADYQVAPEIILAIIGVETRYGRVTGSYRVIDALMTLAFDYPPRAPFFRGQLEQFLLLLDEQQLDVAGLTGSYAGAMGYGQFIAGSYRAYAADGDGDGHIDIWSNKADALASVARYFVRHGWQAGNLVALQLARPVTDRQLLSTGLKPDRSVGQLRKAGVAVPAELADEAAVTLMELETAQGNEYWLGFHNFYVISRYNHSHLYTMAVYQLSQLLRAHLDMP